MSKLLKRRMATELTSYLKDRDAILFVEHGAITSKEIVSLRAGLREKDVRLKLVKNRLALKALEGLSITGLEQYFEGPTAIAVGGEDPVVLSKAVSEAQKACKTLSIKGGVVEGKAVGKDQIERLSNLPSREVLISQVMSMFQAPTSQVARCLNDLNGRVARVLAAVRDQQEEKEKGA